MTRFELLYARANDVVEVALCRDVCLSETECAIVQDAVLVELVGVEREVLARLENKLDDADHIHDVRNWLYDQQQELGS